MSDDIEKDAWSMAVIDSPGGREIRYGHDPSRCLFFWLPNPDREFHISLENAGRKDHAILRPSERRQLLIFLLEEDLKSKYPIARNIIEAHQLKELANYP